MIVKSPDLISIFPDIMINLDKINSQIDLNNFDPGQITKVIIENQKIVKLVFLIGALVIGGMMFNDNHTKEQAIRNRISKEQAKITVISARDSAVKAIDNYKLTVPKAITELELITTISKYANSGHVIISSLNPAESKDMGLYDVINLSFTAVSDNFKDMMLFLRNIENSNPPLRINSWSGREGPDGKVTFEIGLCAVAIH
jgi:hypothetical protein